MASTVPSDASTPRSARDNPFASPVSERTNSDNARLVAAHLAGDGTAFPALVQRYRTRLLAFVYRMIGDAERAEDLVQETFVRVHRHLHRFDPNRKFSTWIYTIASNLAKNELRNRSRSPLVFPESSKAPGVDVRPLEAEDWHQTPDRLYRQRRLYRLVRDVAAELPEHQRKVFVLRELEGMSYEEIARETNTNLGTVKSRLNRARTAFAAMIKPKLE